MAIRFWEGKYMDGSEMKAILDQDFENLLRKLNVYDEVIAGNIHCSFCDDIVNISMVFPQNGKVGFCCNKKNCVDKLLKQRGILE